ncbi:MAG: alpha/beta hydrolase [Filomicrobium sp.]
MLVTSSWSTPADAQNLRINEPIKHGLIAAGTLNTPLGQAKKPVLKKALQVYRDLFSNGIGGDNERADIEALPEKLTEALGLKAVLDGQKLEVLLPTKIVPEAWSKYDGLETLWRASDNNEVWILTFRHGLTNNPPSELLRNILAASREPKDIQLEQTNLHFLIRLRDYLPNPGVQSHQYKQAFAVTDGRIGLFITFRDIIPDRFRFADHLSPWTLYWSPPADIYDASTPEELLPSLQKWADKKHLTDLQREEIMALNAAPDTITPAAIGKMIRLWEWRKTMQIARQWIAEEFANKHRYNGINVKGCLTHRGEKAGVNSNVRVLFATNRAETGSISKENLDPGTWYDNVPADQSKQVIGCATVSVPLQAGATPGLESVHQETWFEGRNRLADDDGKLFRIARANRLGEFDFDARSNHLKFTDTESWLFDREDVALVYVHGYNTSFENALYRTAQIAAAANYPGRVYLFSWPSAESTSGYLWDMDMAERSEVHFSEFMRAIFREPEIRQVDIVAHSMGAQLLTRGLSDLKDLFYSRADVKIRQVILAAPDVAVEVFANKIREIQSLVGGVIVYGSREDVPLWWSRWLRNGPKRLGRYIPASQGSQAAEDDEGDGSAQEALASALPNGIKVVDATRGGNACNFWGYSPFDVSNSHTYFTREPVATSLRRTLSRAARGRSTDRTKSKEALPDREREANCWWKVW